MHISLTLIYIFICYLVALIGKNRKFGFWGYLFLSIFMTPAIGLLFVIASNKQEKK
ncbi:MAG: hypothetical protein QM493_01060 [Sulfurovum sp.]